MLKFSVLKPKFELAILGFNSSKYTQLITHNRNRLKKSSLYIWAMF
jgi:hypothetical protein